MKDIIAFITAFVLIAAMGPFCLAAKDITDADTGFTVPVIDACTVITPENVTDEANKNVLRKLDKSASQMKKSLVDGGYIFRAFTDDNKFIISFSSCENDVSKKVIDLCNCPDDSKETVKELLIGGAIKKGALFREIEKDGALFYKVTMKETKNEATIYYLSIINGKCMTLSLDILSGGLTDNAKSMFDTIFDGMTYTVNTERLAAEKTSNKLYSVLLWIAIAGTVVIAFFIIKSIFRDVEKRRLENDWKHHPHRKPRR